MSDENNKKGESLAEGTLISHLLELRDRFFRMSIALVIVFIPSFIFRNRIFDLLAAPVIKAGSKLITTTVMSPFTTPLKVAFFFSLFVAMPYILYQIWGFVAPGLYKKEKRFAVPLLVSSIVLFYVGVSFAYFFVFPKLFPFFVSVTPSMVENMTDINNYLDTALTIFLGFGIAFEVPVVVMLLTLTGLVSVEKLAEWRGYIVIGIFVVAAVLTPPDPLSQISMAVPMWLLFEAGLIFSRILNRKPPDDTSGTGSTASSA
jgi:sec-independent protein translocase protein TatC